MNDSGFIVQLAALFLLFAREVSKRLALNDTFLRTDRDTGLGVKVSTLVTRIGVDNVNIITGRNGIHRAFRLTCSTIGACFSNEKCHGIFFLKSYLKTIKK